MGRGMVGVLLLVLVSLPLAAQDRGDPRRVDNPRFEDPEYGFAIMKPPRSRDWRFDTQNQTANGLRVRIANDAREQPFFIDVYVQLPDHSRLSLGWDPDNVCDQMLEDFRGRSNDFRDIVQRSRQRSRQIPNEGNCMEMVVEGKFTNADETPFEWRWFVFQSGRNGTLVRIAVMTPPGQFAPQGRIDPEILHILRSFHAFRPRPPNQGGR